MRSIPNRSGGRGPFGRALLAAILLVGAAAATGDAAAQDLSQPGVAPGLEQVYVQGIQQGLAERGFDAGPADGRMGAKTASAIRAYQRKAGLPVDGRPSVALLNHIRFANPRVETGRGPFVPTARREAARPADPTVREIQSLLAERGYRPGPVDGLPGPRASDAARAYQKDAGLPETGTLDRALLDHLRQSGRPDDAPRETPAEAPSPPAAQPKTQEP